jgi:hypothetical protein
MSKRGLVINISSEPIWVDHGAEFGGRIHYPPNKRHHSLAGLTSTGIPENALRAWLLYWDELATADSRLPTVRTNDEKFLIESKVLKLTETTKFETDERAAQFNVFRRLEQLEPGLWCMASEEAASSNKISDQRLEGRFAMVRLFNLLPIPVQETPLAEILEFKERRKDELIHLRIELEGMYQRIASSVDPAAAIATESDRLGEAIGGIFEVTKESGLRFRFGGIEARIKWEFDLERIAATTAGGAMLGGQIGAIIGGATGLMPKIEFSSAAALERSPQRKTPYEYVALAHRELRAVRR